MPARKSSSPKQSSPSKKPSAKAAASRRISAQRKVQSPDVPTSIKKIGQSRFPGETPLTGEDRPARKSGGKKRSRGR